MYTAWLATKKFEMEGKEMEEKERAKKQFLVQVFGVCFRNSGLLYKP